jgi:hypothetical protein
MFTPKMKMMAMDSAMCLCRDNVKHPAAENRSMPMQNTHNRQ